MMSIFGYDYCGSINIYANEYNIVPMNATLPVAYFATSMYNNQTPTFIYLERMGTFDFDKLPAHASLFPGITTSTNWADCKPIAIDYVKKLYDLNPDSKFNLFVSDNYPEFLFEFILLNGIENYTMTMITDGTGTVNIFNRNYTTDIDNQLENFNAKLEQFDNYFNMAKAKDANVMQLLNDDMGRPNSLLQDFCPVIATYDNITWIVTSKENIYKNISTDLQPTFDSLFENGKIVEKKLQEEFENLSSENLIALEYLLKVRWGDGENEVIGSLFDKGNDKKTLMVLGTRTNLEYNSTNRFEEYMNILIENFQEEYNIFYKGHPGTPTYVQDATVSDADFNAKIAYLENNNITDVLSTIPAEILLFLYDDVYIAGYYTSTFLNSMENQTLALFVVKPDDTRLAQFPNLFEETIFIYANAEGVLIIDQNSQD